MRVALKILHCAKGSPLHPALRDAGAKNYFWDGRCEDIIQDWKGVDVVFIKARDYAQRDRWLQRCRELCALMPPGRAPEIIAVADSFTTRELTAMKSDGVFDYFDLRPASTVGERLDFILARIERQRQTVRELRRYQQQASMLKTDNKDLKRLTLMDDLTGLHNTRYMKEIFEGLFDLVHRYKRPLSVFMLDLDHFKKVNDLNDHLVGSTVLKEMGRVLTQHTRKSDLRIRYGGDEFVVIMPETELAAALPVAERVREKIEQLTMTMNSSSVVKTTASLGVATFNHEKHSAYWELLREADMAMYQAKKTGRNRVCTFDGEVAGYDTTKSSFATALRQITNPTADKKKELPTELTRYLNFIKKAA